MSGTGTGQVQSTSISFALAAEAAEALRQLAGNRNVRLAGDIRGGRLVVDAINFPEKRPDEDPATDAFTAVNAPFMTKYV